VQHRGAGARVLAVAVLRASRPATGPAALPPPSSFRRFFAHRCSRMVQLDLFGSLTSERNRKASRRSSTSATESLHEHDRGRSEPRAPRQQSPAITAPIAGGYGRMMDTLPCGRARRPYMANRDVTGQGSGRRRFRFRLPDASSRDRSRGEPYPAPLGSDTSCCKLVAQRTGAFPPPLGVVAVTRGRACHDESAIRRFHPKGPKRKRPFLPSGLQLARPREGASPLPCPRCLPSPVNPGEGRRNPQPVPRLWIVLVPFQSSRIGPLDEVTESRATRGARSEPVKPTPC
jgi:hypothetical protein